MSKAMPLMVAAGVSVGGGVALGQPAIQPPFDVPYSTLNLGFPAGVPQSLGGICFKPGFPDVLLLGGAANSLNAAIYEVPVLRDSDGYITGFVDLPPGESSRAVYSTAQQIDGGLCVIPGSGGTVAFTTFNNNHLGQVVLGTTAPTRYESMTPLGVAGTTGTCQFVPPGFPGAGNFVVGTYGGGTWYVLPLTLDPQPGLASSTYIPGTASEGVFTGGGPEGLVYVPTNSPIFGTTPTLLVSEFGTARIMAFDVGPNGLPVPETARVFMSGLGGAEGGCLDPRTNSFLFSTFGGGGIQQVIGFTLPQCNSADIGRIGGTRGYDGRLNNNDFIVFIDMFFGAEAAADIGRQGGVAGSDGLFDNNDFIVFIDRFFRPCDV